VKKVRLLLKKDLRILGRSPVLVAALIVYPLVFAALIGAVVRYAGDRPTIAFVDLDHLPEQLRVGGQTFNVPDVLDQVNENAELVPMDQEEADRKLSNGEVNAEIIVPRGFASRLRGMVESPQLELKTARGGIAARVEQQTQALVYGLNQRLQDAYIDANLQYVNLIVEGGTGTFLGNEFDVVGLQRAGDLLAQIEQTTKDPVIAEQARELSNFVRQAQLALGASGESLRATANPIKLEVDTEAGRSWLLSAQLQAYAASDDPDVREAIRSGFGSLHLFVETVSGVDAERVAEWFAKGMLLNVIAAMDLWGSHEPWARRLLEGSMDPETMPAVVRKPS